MPLPLHQKRWPLLTLHGTVVCSGAGSGLEHPDLGISKFHPPFFVSIFSVLYYIIVVYFDFVNFFFIDFL